MQAPVKNHRVAFRLRWLFLVTAIFGLAFWGLINAGPTVLELFRTITLVLLLAASVGALAGSEATKLFCRGFLLGTWTHLIFALYYSSTWELDMLGTTHGLHWLWQKTHTSGGPLPTLNQAQLFSQDPEWEYFAGVGLQIVSVSIGLVVGVLALILRWRHQPLARHD